MKKTKFKTLYYRSMVLRNLVLFLSLFFVFSVYPQTEKMNEFVVTIFDRSIKVISPKQIQSKVSIVIENKSLRPLVGKIQTNSGRLISLMSLETNSFKKVITDIKKGERVFFVPLSPAFQEAELIVGRETYEIPPKH